MGAPLCACTALPTLTFPDATPDDALNDAGGDDGGPGSCTPPDGASPYTCCGTIACVGPCSATVCDQCRTSTKCQDPGVFCCAHMNNVVCQPLTMMCK